jgi:hypothetical protein
MYYFMIFLVFWLNDCFFIKKNNANQKSCINFDYTILKSVIDTHNLLNNSTISIINYDNLSYRVIKIDNNISIKLLNENFINETPINISLSGINCSQRNSIFIKDKIFCIDSLFLEKEFNFDSPTIVNTIIGVYKFNIKESDFLAFYFQDLINSSTNVNTLIMLFDITNEANIKYIPIGFQSSENIYCFDDYNNDGNLDYYAWFDYSDSLFLFKYDEGHFHKSEYFLKINYDHNFEVCKEDSKWIKDIWN